MPLAPLLILTLCIALKSLQLISFAAPLLFANYIEVSSTPLPSLIAFQCFRLSHLTDYLYFAYSDSHYINIRFFCSWQLHTTTSADPLTICFLLHVYSTR